MTSVIIDDHEKSRSFLKGHIRDHFPELQIIAEAETVNSGIEIIQRFNPDIVFLDIELPDSSGPGILDELFNTSNNYNFKTVLTTNLNQLSPASIQPDAREHVLTPANPEELTITIEKIKKQLTQKKNRKSDPVLIGDLAPANHANKKIVLNTTDKVYVYKAEEIIRCEAIRGYTIFYINNTTQVVISKNLGEIEELLSGFNFERIHKSHLINMDYLQVFNKGNGGSVRMQNGDELPVSNRKREYLLNLLKSL